MAKINDLSKLGEATGFKSSNPPQKKSYNEHKNKDKQQNSMTKLDIHKILSINSLGLEELRTLLDDVEGFVKQKEVSNLTAGQVRTIYAIIQEVEDIKGLHLKRPELAFVAAKQDSNNVKEVLNFFMDIIKQATTKEHLQNIKDFTASFLKYHKLYGTNKQ